MQQNRAIQRAQERPRQPKSTQNRTRVDPKSVQNRSWGIGACLDRFRSVSRSSRDAPRTAKDTFGTPQERSRDNPGCSRTAQEHSRCAPKTLPRSAWSDPRRLLSAFALVNAFRDPRGAIFDRFGFDAQQLRSAFRTGFYDVFSMLDVLRIERSWHAKTSKKQAFRARKSRPGASRRGPDEQVRAAKRPSRATKRARSSHIEPIEGISSRPGQARSLGCSPKSSAGPKLVSVVGEFRY